MITPPYSIAMAVPSASRITARIAIRALACRPASPVFGSKRPAISISEKPARVANRTDEWPSARYRIQLATP